MTISFAPSQQPSDTEFSRPAPPFSTAVNIGECQLRHRHQEWLKFLKKIDAETPPNLDLHLILDNYATHKHASVRKWLKKHLRFHLHFIPTSSSWLNIVERWFREITD